MADVCSIANGMKAGNGLHASVDMGPLISAKQQGRVQGYIDMGRELGATIACGGTSSGPGYVVRPTLITDVDQKCPLVQEEIFAPVLVAQPFDDLADAIRLANDIPIRVAASI